MSEETPTVEEIREWWQFRWRNGVTEKPVDAHIRFLLAEIQRLGGSDPDPRNLLAELWQALYGEALGARPESAETLWQMCIADTQQLAAVSADLLEQLETALRWYGVGPGGPASQQELRQDRQRAEWAINKARASSPTNESNQQREHR